jgi:DNA invertase Pin-like site-specific DNA recombinase
MAKSKSKTVGQSKVIGYLRVSTSEQDTANQELAIRRHCEGLGLTVNNFMHVQVSSRKTTQQRRIDELLDSAADESLNKGDVLIVSELSRLGRSVGQVINIVDGLLAAGVRFISIKEKMDLNGSTDIQSKVMITIFSLLADLERTLISMRTKEGLAKARAEGKLLGRPRGPGKSTLDDKKEEIENMLNLGVPKTVIAKAMGTHVNTLNHWIKTRKPIGGQPKAVG